MSAIQEADIQLTDERKRLFDIEEQIKTGLASVSKRPETTLALRNVQLAYMWLGKAKGHLGITNPYPNSTNTANKTIEPPADRDEKAKAYKFEDEIFFCKAVRDELSRIAKAIENDTTIFVDRRMYQLSVENAYTAAENSKMWLGIILGQIREKQLSGGKKQSSKKEGNDNTNTGTNRNDDNGKQSKVKSIANKVANIITGGSSADKASKAGSKHRG